MSLDYNDAMKRARPGTAFSNGTEFECWEARWCCRCLRDAPFRNTGKGSGCPLLLIALTGDHIPAEWLDQTAPGQLPRLGDQYHCIEFRAPGGGGEPKPKPEPTDMDGLFPRPERRVRMCVQPQEAEVSA